MAPHDDEISVSTSATASSLEQLVDAGSSGSSTPKKWYQQKQQSPPSRSIYRCGQHDVPLTPPSSFFSGTSSNSRRGRRGGSCADAGSSIAESLRSRARGMAQRSSYARPSTRIGSPNDYNSNRITGLALYRTAQVHTTPTCSSVFATVLA